MKDFDLIRIEKCDFDLFYTYLENDFCSSERKTRSDELKAFDTPAFLPCFIRKDGLTVGYICLWSFEEFIYVEHFAILKEYRNQNMGSAFLSEFLKEVSKKVILEVERPVDDIAKRRIEFYKRAGFYVNMYDYIQPTYYPGADKIPMYICSFGGALSPCEYALYTSQICSAVYPPQSELK